jgi:putative membrane-bound dehydrogenase-like protein
MSRRWFLAALGVLGLAVGLAGWAWHALAEQPAAAQWVWFDEGDPTMSAPAETRFFRRVFTIDRPVPKPVDEATLEITADNAFTVWINGALVGKGDDWNELYKFDVQKHLVNGKNVIAVEAKNEGGPAGLVVRLAYLPNGMTKLTLFSDAAWKSSKTAADGWQKVEFDEKGWSAVKVLGTYGEIGPWKGSGTPVAGGKERFKVPAGFHVEELAPASAKVTGGDPKKPFSLVNMGFDARGRLLVSQEGGPILLCTDPDKNGVYQSIKPYCEQVKNCHGICWVKDALLLVGDGPQGTGLYRVRDTDGDDKTDKAELLFKYQGGMGEHGPHAVLQGPDGWLYLVIGNHAHAQPEKLADNSPLTRWPKGSMGPDQGKPDTTEDVLLPRLNDARGHAANILAPGGTIWRVDTDGKNASLVAAGFRNHFDAAFNPDGELFTYDSDMEWDENLPWYRAVRVCHCTPGADFVWRTGAANTPNYYIDSLPPTYETGRGSPVGLEFYDHDAFPQKYRGAFFMADWSVGIIYAVLLEKDGATYKPTVEKFCVGTPMNVTDLAVGPDGALYFVLGGRGSQGGVYRIVADEAVSPKRERGALKPWEEAVTQPQPLSAWGRAHLEELHKALKPNELQGLAWQVYQRERWSVRQRIGVANVLHEWGELEKRDYVIQELLRDEAPEARAHGVWLLGLYDLKDRPDLLQTALKDKDAFVRRRACEALIRAGIEPPVDAVWPLLSDADPFLRTAARLVLQRIDPKKWADRLAKEPNDKEANDLAAFEAIIALCKTNQAAPQAETIFRRLQKANPKDNVDALLNQLRTVQLALVHTGTPRPGAVKEIATDCDKRFPHADWRVNRELAILLTGFRRDGVLDASVVGKLVKAMTNPKEDRQQQIHYFYCLRLLKEGWTPDQKQDALTWYEGTKSWQGGFSFTPFLENIFREILDNFTVAERKHVLETAETTPLAALVLAQKLQTDKQAELLPALQALAARLPQAGKLHRADELTKAVTDAVAKTTLAAPGDANWATLVKNLDSTDPVVLFETVEALKKSPTKPKPEDAAAYRSAVVATSRLDEKNRWKGIELLRQWSGNRKFGAEDGAWKPELASWARWYAQAFPKEPALPKELVALDKPVESKYKFDELKDFLEKDPAGVKGDAAKGRVVFEKAQCLKCHKYGKDGEGIGPDLTTLSKRFKRVDVLDSIIYPSKVISDQYRSTTIETKKGQQFTGLVAPMNGMLVVLLTDGTKVTLKEDDVAERYASLVSVMPEKLLDPLTKQEIADLFAFLESDPPK